MVAAACVMTLAAYTASRSGGTVGDSLTQAHAPIVALALLLLAYLFGTVLYVKSMIRERGVPAYARASVAYHGAATLAAVPMALAHHASWWWAVAFLAVMTVRAGALSGRRVTPKALGIGEIVASVALAAIAVLLR
jgi:hypothetical protein